MDMRERLLEELKDAITRVCRGDLVNASHRMDQAKVSMLYLIDAARKGEKYTPTGFKLEVKAK